MTSKVEGAVLNAASKVEAFHEKRDEAGKSANDGAATDGTSDKKKDDSDSKSSGSSGKEGPAGGYDDTPIPSGPPGYTLKFTFHRATNLPMADIPSFSSDPYVHATLFTGLPTRHKEDPPITLRTPTIRRSTEPVWDTEWVVANVPSHGFKLECRINDEDPADHDDRLGKATIVVNGIDETWPGIQEGAYKIKKRTGSKRAYAMRGIAVALRKTKHMDGSLFLSVENLGKTKDEDGSGRVYTVGPMWWTKHYSPMLGRLAHTTDEAPNADHNTKKYNFQANQFQLHGPVPKELYHRFVEFKPFVKRMFTSSGIQGFLLSKALHHQHHRVYNFGRTTEYGVFKDGPSKEATLKFLDLVHWDEGGRIFTYVLTLDSLFRFTETGKEFGIDFLSKHTMHSDVNIYIAFSGEFFIRRLKHKNRPTPEEHLHEGKENKHSEVTNEDQDEPPKSANDQTESHPPEDVSGGPPNDEPPREPEYYELVIDNDSGTYRPNAELLPKLKAYLQSTLPGLHIVTLDCQADADLQQRMKKEQRARKKSEGENIIYHQTSHGADDSSSISSSDISDLDAMELEASQERQHTGDVSNALATKIAKAKAKKDAEMGWKAIGKDYYEKGKSRGQKYKFIVTGRDGGRHVVDDGGKVPEDASDVKRVPAEEADKHLNGDVKSEAVPEANGVSAETKSEIKRKPVSTEIQPGEVKLEEPKPKMETAAEAETATEVKPEVEKVPIAA